MTDDILFEGPKVNLIGSIGNKFYVEEETIIPDLLVEGRYISLGPDEISGFGALGCFEEESSIGLVKKIMPADGEDRTAIDKKLEKVFEESAGRGHGSVLDQNAFIYSIENITRAATLQLCLPSYLSHLQQSLRRATASRAFFVPEAIRESSLFEEAKEVQYDAFRNYVRWGEADKPDKERSDKAVPLEDARYPLPLLTKTNIQTLGDARELTHLQMMNKQGEVPSHVQKPVDMMIEEATQFAPKLFKERAGNRELLSYYPSPQLYASTNETIKRLIEKYDYPSKTILVGHSGLDIINERTLEKAVKERNETELSNLKHVHFEFLTQMSLAAYHQATRQRTWDHSLQSIYDAVEPVGCLKIPPKIESSEYIHEFNEQNRRQGDLYYGLIKEGVPRSEAIGVVPHALMIYDLIHVNGWNAIHSIGKRTCTKAQWEIRKIANDMAKEIKKVAPMFENYAAPQCMTYGKCPERNPCKPEFKQ